MGEARPPGPRRVRLRTREFRQILPPPAPRRQPLHKAPLERPKQLGFRTPGPLSARAARTSTGMLGRGTWFRSGVISRLTPIQANPPQ